MKETLTRKFRAFLGLSDEFSSEQLLTENKYLRTAARVRKFSS